MGVVGDIVCTGICQTNQTGVSFWSGGAEHRSYVEMLKCAVTVHKRSDEIYRRCVHVGVSQRQERVG